MTTIISIGSGKGGVGKSMLSSNLAVLLAGKGYKATLIDLDAGGANAHIMFGVFKPERTLGDFMLHRVETLQDVMTELKTFNKLQLIPGMGESMYTANLPTGAKDKLLRHIRKLDTDFVIIDVGAGTNYNTLDYFMMADYNICISTPEPTAVLDLYRFVKLAVIRKALSVFLARDDVRKTIAKTNIQNISEIFSIAEQAGEEKKAAAEAAVKSFRPLLVANRSGDKKKKIHMLQLQQLLKKYVGVGSITKLGEIPVDTEVEDSIGAFQPVVSYSPNSPAAKAIGEIADELIKIIEHSATQPAGDAEQNNINKTA